jgi:GNAT superfamily N-acetyltransferase
MEYPARGNAGITYVEEKLGPDAICEALLYYDTRGRLAGIFNYFPNDMPVSEPSMKAFFERAGTCNIIANSRHRRLGIGIKLLREAINRWPIQFENQNYTLEGAKLVQRFLSEE